MKVYFSSLGCDKNLSDSEHMLYLLSKAGYSFTDDPEDAEVIIVNSCCFIGDAQEESIREILSLSRMKDMAKCRALVVTGCLSERYQAEIQKELPEIDAVLGVGSFSEIVPAAEAVLAGKAFRSFEDNSAPVEEIPRVVSTGPGWAWLRIAEGCDNFCAFCAIPYIRGRYRSREMEAVLREAEGLAQAGVKELIVIAQDITRYGTDRYGKRCLAELCRRLSAIEGIEWIRLHYLYPDAFDDELIDEIAGNSKILKYLDIPIQHINNDSLKHMNRRGTGDEIRDLFRRLRERIPDLVLRTSLITGLPGEGEEEFRELCEFLHEAKIERAGVFPFSPEEGTPAAAMPHADAETAAQRADQILQLQGTFLDAFAERQVGRTLPILIERYDEEEACWIGRSYADSPEIDSFVCAEGDCRPGEIRPVRITGAENGILYGTIREEAKEC